MKSKRYYSVKEAANILGVSTNTIYSYLDKGTIHAKRLGRGRFKIPATDLAPYLNPVRVTARPLINFNFDKFMLRSLFGKSPGYEFEGNFLFWRMYVAYLMLAVGAIHLFWHPNLFLSLPLIIGGIATFFIAENWQEHPVLSFWIHVFDFLALLTASLISFFGGFYYMIIFLVPTAICVFVQIIVGVNKLSREGSLVREFTASLIVSLIIIGILSLVKPGFLPMEYMQNFVLENRITFSLLSILATAPVVYIYWVLYRSHLHERCNLEPVVFSVYGIGSLVGASIYLNLGIWDMAYACFFYAFLTFIVVWFRKAGTISAYRKTDLRITFGWICAGIIVGIFAMFLIQEKLKQSVLQSMESKIDTITNNINDSFMITESTITSSVEDLNLSGILVNRDTDGAEAYTRTLYDKLSNLNRVLVYDKNGIAIGVYPRSSLTEGTNFSSRDYFQIAKSSTKPYLSGVFDSVLGTKTVLYMVPVFKNSVFLGGVGVAFNLETLSEKFQSSNPSGEIFAVDRTGNYVLNNDSTKLGQKPPEIISGNIDKNKFQTDFQLIVCLSAGVPEWRVCKETTVSDITQVLYIANVIIIICIFVNAVQTLRAGFSLSEKSKKYV